MILDLLLRIGLVRRLDDGALRWPFHVAPWWIWRVHLGNPGWLPGHNPHVGGWFDVFRNRPGVVRKEPGRLLPRRWGVRIVGLEIGDRG